MLLRSNPHALPIRVECFGVLVLRREYVPQVVRQGGDKRHTVELACQTQAFLQRWDEALKQWQAKAAPLKGMNYVAYHKFWAYLADWLGMKEIATIEPKPGVPPGSAYIAQLVDELPKRSVGIIIYSSYEDPRPSEAVGQRTRIPAVMLPATVGGTDASTTLFALYDDVLNRLLAARGAKSG